MYFRDELLSLLGYKTHWNVYRQVERSYYPVTRKNLMGGSVEGGGGEVAGIVAITGKK
jgi:hypothetical protein